MEPKQVDPISFVVTNPLIPVGPAQQLFIAGVSAFEITVFEPPVQRVTIVGINLPSPGIFGPFDRYVAVLQVPGDLSPLAEVVLQPTPDNSVWAASTLLFFGGTLPPINVAIRPQQNGQRIGPIILEGPVFS